MLLHDDCYDSLNEMYHNVSFENILGQQMCKTQLMLSYLLEQGFDACTVSVKYLRRVLRLCHDNDLDVIIHMNVDPLLGGGHYVVFRELVGSEIFIDDPAKDMGNTHIKTREFFKHLKEAPFCGVARDNTLLIVNTRKHPLLCTHFDCEDECRTKVFDCIKDFVKEFLCPVHDKWIRVKHRK